MIKIGFIFGVFLPAIAFAGSDIIEKIDIVGNEKTSRETILRLSELEEGQEFTAAILKEARNLISSSGAFEDVKISNRQGKELSSRIITIEVKEKMSWFIFPSFSYSQTGFAGGGVLGETNLFGRLKKVAAYGNWGPDVRVFAGGYRDPDIWGSPLTLSLDFIYRLEDMAEYVGREESRKVYMREWGGTFLPGIRWTENVVTSMGLYYRRIRERNLRETNPTLDIRTRVDDYGNDIAVVVQFDFNKTKFYEGLMEGTEIKLLTQFSDDRYFSDYDYNKQLVYLSQGFTFLNHKANFVTKASVQLGKNIPYYIELMAGGENLRGYLDRQFRGDTKYSFSQELMLPIYYFSRFILRSSVFWDNTIIYFKDIKDGRGDAFTRNHWHNGIGVGLKVYLKGIAIPLVGIDFARGIEDGRFAYYINVGTVF